MRYNAGLSIKIQPTFFGSEYPQPALKCLPLGALIIRRVKNVITQIGRVIFFHCEHDGHAFEHRDLDGSKGTEQGFSPHNNEFIHIRYRTKRGFYIWDPEAKQKHYVNSCAAFWNDQDWHGGETSNEQEYGLRIDCKFSDRFKEEIGVAPPIVMSIPLETFVSRDDKFNFHTYLCVIKNEFIPKLNAEHNGYAWVSFNNWPKPLHQGLRNTLQNKANLTKLETVFKLVSLMEQK